MNAKARIHDEAHREHRAEDRYGWLDCRAGMITASSVREKRPKAGSSAGNEVVSLSGQPTRTNRTPPLRGPGTCLLRGAGVWSLLWADPVARGVQGRAGGEGEGLLVRVPARFLGNGIEQSPAEEAHAAQAEGGQTGAEQVQTADRESAQTQRPAEQVRYKGKVASAEGTFSTKGRSTPIPAVPTSKPRAT